MRGFPARRHRHARAFAPPLALLLLAAACGDNEAECRAGIDCVSGACGADGRCLPPGTSSSTSSAGGGATATTSGAGGGAAGAGGDPSAGGSTSTGGAPCSANGDSTITRAEIPLQAGLSAKYLAAQDVSVDTEGSAQGDGTRRWDFAEALPGDHLALVETLAPDEQWYAELFPTATYAAKLTDEADLHGVFELTTSALLLLGVVSPGGGVLRTELSYDPPVVVLDFPLEPGKSWATSSTVSGLASGVLAYYSETYEQRVDARGQAATPYAELPVLRVHTELVRKVGPYETFVQQHAFVAECFGTVTTVRSQDGEEAVEFDSASEILRLSP